MVTGINIFDEIRKRSKQVAEQAEHIKINYEKLEAYLFKLPIEKVNNPPLDPNVHYLKKGKDTLAFFLTLETINFGSGYFPHLNKNGQDSGYFTVAAALYNYYVEKGPLSALELSQLSAKDCATIFGQSLDQLAVRELMERFADALNQLGFFLIKKFEGKYDALIQAANHSAEKLVNLLIQIPCFNDVAVYKNQKIPFLKRAQITAADISLAFSNQGLGYFNDLDKLTIFADNMVPHVLRCDGILTYGNHLSKLIDMHQLIPANSIEEIEIRACAIHTVELIKERFANQGHHFTSVDLDYLLWNRGQDSYYKTTFPIHLTRTIFY